MKKIQREIARGQRQPDEENPFELFIGSTDIRYCYYKESHRILGAQPFCPFPSQFFVFAPRNSTDSVSFHFFAGQTFGVCVLQDFQALTPNLLARTIETVEGGGLVILLLKTMHSLKQLYTMSMVNSSIAMRISCSNFSCILYFFSVAVSFLPSCWCSAVLRCLSFLLFALSWLCLQFFRSCECKQDVHSRYRTEAHQDVVNRFNERFLLSLGLCKVGVDSFFISAISL